jgi:acetoin utilization protein AcuB
MMLVQDVMQRGVVTVDPDAPLPQAMGLLQRRGIRHLPVLHEGRLVGIISDRDVKAAMGGGGAGPAAAAPGGSAAGLAARDIMTRPVVTIAPMFPVEEAARIMVTRKISALPVTEADRLIGIVTETDVLELFVRAMGVTEPSSRLDVALGDQPRALDQVVQAVEESGVVISSIMTLRSPVTGLREAVIRVTTIAPGPAIRALEGRGFRVRDASRAGLPGAGEGDA